MAVNNTIETTTFTETIVDGSTIIKSIHLNEINDAITILQSLKTNVNNCDCAVCTDNCCQTCQSKTCQSNCTCSDCNYNGEH